jgi:hypothetical protein
VSHQRDIFASHSTTSCKMFDATRLCLLACSNSLPRSVSLEP